MAINKKLNKRLDITLPKSQAEWLENNTEKMEISKSKFISWILAKRIKQIIEELRIYEEPDTLIRRNEIDKQIDDITDEEIEDLIKRAKQRKVKEK